MVNLEMQNVLDHFKDPDNYGVLNDYTHFYELKNLSCGDKITVYLDIQNNIIQRISFTGEGCAISQASMSMLSEEIKGMNLQEFRKLDSQFIKNLLGMDLGPSRLKCASLGLEAVRHCLT